MDNNLLKSCKKLIDYWKRTGPLHFQTEKLASYFSMIEAGINEIDPSQVVREKSDLAFKMFEEMGIKVVDVTPKK